MFSITIAKNAICLPFGLLLNAHLVEVVSTLKHFNVLLVEAEVLVTMVAKVLL